MDRQKLISSLLDWFALNARPLPWRRTSNPYAIWVSEIMLQQTQVKTVIPYWERWMEALPDIKLLARVGPRKLHKLWEGLGYYTRVRNMQKAAQVILDHHQGVFPQNFPDILALPGIGRYTAGAIASIAFSQPRPILDGNVIRVLCRLFAVAGDPRAPKTNSALWLLAEELVTSAAQLSNRKGAKHAVPSFNQSLMELGALICTPRQPRCEVCPVSKMCVARRENRVEQLPAPKPRPTVTKRHFVAFIVQNHTQFLIQQRPAGVVNGHLWEFPNTELNGEKLPPLEMGRRLLGRNVAAVEPFLSLQHSITRYRITLDAFKVTTGCLAQEGENRRWCSLQQMRRLPFSSAHKKILTALHSRRANHPV